MIQYRVKSSEGIQAFLEIVREHPDGYDVIITNIYEDYKKETREFLTRQLFETCLRTGYLIKIDEPEYQVPISA
ncbi:MAG: hypothetical protein E4H36_13960 [Spirochaetales bacterium]|nr:MAG: hypothetical protein E4H36_13960 [Spirochaetales bacterium]